MCGICGKMTFGSGPPVEQSTVKAMADTIRHRGPDADGFFVEGRIGLGHRRLRIIDLEGGIQPMFNEDRTVAVSFNGEIYNFQELRKELLQAGHKFQTVSDTEVLVHGYETWGTGLPERLRGMFAFAIWDGRKEELFLARDRLGIKPLYVREAGGTLHFASELKAILADPEVDRELNPEALDDFLTYLYISAPKTIFRGIEKLEAGHWMLARADGKTIREKYWDVAFIEKNHVPEGQVAEAILEKLKESVRIRLTSDVPLGAFLSGGIDSSAVVGLMAGMLDRPVDTATIGFDDSAFDEAEYARQVARKFGTNAHEETVQPKAAEILDTLMFHFDEPFADHSMVPTYYVSEAARRHVTVCLSGDGGDENFAGYRRYRFDVLENRLRAMLPDWLRQPVFGAMGKVYPKADWLPQPLRAKTLLTNLSYSPERGYFNTMTWFGAEMKRMLYPAELKQQLAGYDPLSVMQRHFDKTAGWDALSRIQYVDIKTYLVDDILTKVDRASMAHSLEVRVPLLDHEFVEMAAAVPARLKLKDGSGKHILKQALSGLVPDEILHRPKQGFSVPLAQWFRGDLKPLFEDSVLASGSLTGQIFHTRAVDHWWQQHQRATRDYAYQFWALLVFESWAKRYLST